MLFNPFDPAFRADPYPFYDTLRATEPVHRTPFGMIVLSRYEDIANTLRSPDFSHDMEANGTEPIDPVRKRLRERRRDRIASGKAAKTILNLDPPDHTRLRRLVSLAFTPTAIARLRPRIQQVVDAALDAAAERGTIELVDDLAFPVPFQVISDLLDMPTDRAEEMRDWSQFLTAGLEPTADEATSIAAADAADKMNEYVASIIEERRRSPGDDLLSALIAVEEEGDRLSPVELLSFVTLLYVAGHETTVNLIGNGALAMLRNRPQLEAWRADPSIGPRAIDELLRFDGPVQLTVRIAMKPVRYDDIEVQPGDSVMTLLGAANHDPAVFEDPHALRFDRANANRHLAFSSGIHYCLGASLARLEAEVALGSLVQRFSSIELTDEPHWRDRLTIRGVDRLPLAISA